MKTETLIRANTLNSENQENEEIEKTYRLGVLGGVRLRDFAVLVCDGDAHLQGLKPPLDYSVYSASACALLLALDEHCASASSEISAEKEV